MNSNRDYLPPGTRVVAMENWVDYELEKRMYLIKRNGWSGTNEELFQEALRQIIAEKEAQHADA